MHGMVARGVTVYVRGSALQFRWHPTVTTELHADSKRSLNPTMQCQRLCLSLVDSQNGMQSCSRATRALFEVMRNNSIRGNGVTMQPRPARANHVCLHVITCYNTRKSNPLWESIVSGQIDGARVQSDNEHDRRGNNSNSGVMNLQP